MSESSTPMSEHIEELTAGYVLNTLSPEEVREFEQLLQENPALTSKMTELQELMGLVAYAAPQVSAPKHLRSKVLEAAQNPFPATAAPQVEQIKQPLPKQKPAFPWNIAAIAAASVLVLFLGVDNYHLRQRLALMQTKLVTLQQREQKADRADFALRGTPVATAAEGRILLDVKAGKALISLKNLPPAPPGMSYRLWAFMENKEVLCGTFNTSSSGRILDEMPISPKDYPGPVLFVRVSRESADSSQRVWVMTSKPV
jgi:Anti-sigma-K factor rskA